MMNTFVEYSTKIFVFLMLLIFVYGFAQILLVSNMFEQKCRDHGGVILDGRCVDRKALKEIK